MPQILVKGFSITSSGGYVNVLIQNPGSQTFNVNSITANVMDGNNRLGTLSYLPGAGAPYVIKPSSSSTLQLKITIDPIGAAQAAIGIGEQIFSDISKGGTVVDAVGHVLNLDSTGAIVKDGISIYKYFTDGTSSGSDTGNSSGGGTSYTPANANDYQGGSYSPINDGTGNLVDETTGTVYDSNGAPTGYQYNSDTGSYVDSSGSVVDSNGTPIDMTGGSDSGYADNTGGTDAEYSDYTDLTDGNGLSGIYGTTITLDGVANISGINIPFTQTLTGAQQAA